MGVEELNVRGLRAPCAWIPCCRSLARLTVLDGPGLEAKDWALFAQALQASPAAAAMRELIVRRVIPQGRQAAESLGTALGAMPALRKLDMSDNRGLGKEVWRQVAAGLLRGPAGVLEELDARYSGAGAAELAGALGALKKLQLRR